MGSEAVNVKIRREIFISIVKGLRRGGEAQGRAFGSEEGAEREGYNGRLLNAFSKVSSQPRHILVPEGKVYHQGRSRLLSATK